jgi:hypothetical protein
MTGPDNNIPSMLRSPFRLTPPPRDGPSARAARFSGAYSGHGGDPGEDIVSAHIVPPYPAGTPDEKAAFLHIGQILPYFRGC